MFSSLVPPQLHDKGPLRQRRGQGGVVNPGEQGQTISPGEQERVMSPGKQRGMISPGEDGREITPGEHDGRSAQVSREG